MGDLSGRLLGWYDRNARAFPWRGPKGVRPDPYAVWLSEIMLQQTRAAAVAPYYQAFLDRWPTVGALAAATLDDVLAAWAGLGYYARARNLHACARVVAANGGRFPIDEAGLRMLPGIGVYTAAAIAAIAYDAHAAAVDGNVERVLSRLYAVAAPLPKSRPRLRKLAATLVPKKRTGDFAQALIELGATVCAPRSPRCGNCPIFSDCKAAAIGRAETFPRRAPKPLRPTRFGVCFWLIRRGKVLLRRRPPTGLLGGMLEVPGTDWRGQPWDLSQAVALAPTSADWKPVPGPVLHTFTHFHLELMVLAASYRSGDNLEGTWVAFGDLDRVGLPRLMAKVVQCATLKSAAA
jgi:A/G-specific adenine glycosylase